MTSKLGGDEHPLILRPETTARVLTGEIEADYGGRDGYGFETRAINGVRMAGHRESKLRHRRRLITGARMGSRMRHSRPHPTPPLVPTSSRPPWL